MPQVGESRPPVTETQYEQWKTDLTNWGRWGEDDEIGALNLITLAKRLQAVALVEDGVTVSLAGDADTVEAVDNPNPYEHTMLGISSDRIAVSYHGIAHTHLDALAHVNADGVFYNGYQPDPEAVVENGHARNSIHNVKDGIVTRGVLIDIPGCEASPTWNREPPSTSKIWRSGNSRPVSGCRRATRCLSAPASGPAGRRRDRGCGDAGLGACPPGCTRR